MSETAGVTAIQQPSPDAYARGVERLRALPEGRRAVVEATAILDPLSGDALTALLEMPAGGALEQLQVAGLVYEEAGRLRLEDGLRAAALGSLDEQPARLLELHGRAAEHFVSLLAQADPAMREVAEAGFARHFESRCEALARYEPGALAEVAEAAPIELLGQAGTVQLVRYFRGLGLGLRGQISAARAVLGELLAEPNLGELIAARAENSGALFAQAQGDYAAARRGFERSLSIWERMRVQGRQATLLLNLGVLLHETDLLDEAEERLLMAVARADEAGLARGQALARLQLGQVYRDNGRWADALEQAQRASELFIGEGDTDQQARCSILCGEVELLRGELDAAAGWFAMAIGELQSRAYEAEVWIDMGLLCQAEGNHVDALDRFETALAVAAAAGRADLLPQIDYRKGLSQERLGATQAALAHYTAASSDGGARRGGRLQRLLGSQRLASEAALALCVAAGDAERAFGYAERARARAQGGQQPLNADEARAALPPSARLLIFYTSGLLGSDAALVEALPQLPSGLRDALAPELRLVRLLLSQNSAQATLLPVSAGLERDAALVASIADELAAASEIFVVRHGLAEGLDFAALVEAGSRISYVRAAGEI
jgi:tetratricopeptide (TPR) repeat protein